METFVLIPEQLSLELSGDGSELRVVSNQNTIPRGSRFSPFQGTLRTDEKLTARSFNGGSSKVQERERYCSWGGLRAASWVRFLRQSVQISSEVNLVELILPGGQVVYEVHRPINLWEELVVFSTEPPLTFTKALKEAIFEETMKALLLEVPLDLSTSLFHKVVRPFPLNLFWVPVKAYVQTYNTLCTREFSLSTFSRKVTPLFSLCLVGLYVFCSLRISFYQVNETYKFLLRTTHLQRLTN